jgi:alpha-D-ribose 1-methylphosphonate 5-triphosphate synthase subunit PhnL
MSQRLKVRNSTTFQLKDITGTKLSSLRSFGLTLFGVIKSLVAGSGKNTLLKMSVANWRLERAQCPSPDVMNKQSLVE